MPELDLGDVDFEGVDVSGFTQLDPGTYMFQIAEPPREEFKDDKRFLTFNFLVLGGPEQKEAFPDGSKDPAGKKWRDRVYLTPNAMWRFKRLLICAGLLARDDKTSPIAQGKMNTDLLAGQKVQVNLTPNINAETGKEYRNVEYVI